MKSFAVCWAHRVCGEKFCDFFPSPPSLFHGFPTVQNSYECFNESFMFLTWTLIKTVISIYSEMDKSKLLTKVCADFSFPRWPCSHRRRRAIQLKWVQDKTAGLLTASLLASSASYFLISWQKPSRFFTTTVECFLWIFHGVKV